MRKTVRRALLVLVIGTSIQVGLSQDQQAASFSIEGVGLAQPESVLYDLESGTYLVSNVSSSPFAEDGNGFISRLAPDGRVLELG